MNKLPFITTAIFAAIAAALVFVPGTSVASTSLGSNKFSEGDAKLAKMLDGREAGEPVRCIPMSSHTSLTVIDKTALVYRSGRTLYVNIPRDPESLDSSDTLVRRTSFASRLCNTDIITTVHLPSGMYTGNVFLGDFIPYRKVDKDAG